MCLVYSKEVAEMVGRKTEQKLEEAFGRDEAELAADLV